MNTKEGYTPAYTLKEVAIHLLSFFSSDSIEQTGGRYSINLEQYARRGDPLFSQAREPYPLHGHFCGNCGFAQKVDQNHPDFPARADRQVEQVTETLIAHPVDNKSPSTSKPGLDEKLLALPDEILLLITEELDTKDLQVISQVCPKLGEFTKSYDTVRLRELQCFCLKESFLAARIGIGVHVSGHGKLKKLKSEFDLLSQQAFDQFCVRHSIQGRAFEYWLPLPISYRHWRSVKRNADASLARLAEATSIGTSIANVKVLYSFMSDIVVRLSNSAEQTWGDRPKSTLTHASEKAMDSYFGLFHLLLCLATQQPQIVHETNRQISRFVNGETSKTTFPNLAQLLIAILTSDEGLTQDLTLAIIKETILRNVVWMLDRKGAGMPELSYIEPSSISSYRIQRTFAASKTSYRLLMFHALFSRTARLPGKPVSEICDEMFKRHGAPSANTAETLAASIRGIQNVDSFRDFFDVMGLKDVPSKEMFCGFLKRTIGDSVEKGYSRWALSQGQALAMRKRREAGIEEAEGVVIDSVPPSDDCMNFFPKPAEG